MRRRPKTRGRLEDIEQQLFHWNADHVGMYRELRAQLDYVRVEMGDALAEAHVWLKEHDNGRGPIESRGIPDRAVNAIAHVLRMHPVFTGRNLAEIGLTVWSGNNLDVTVIREDAAKLNATGGLALGHIPEGPRDLYVQVLMDIVVGADIVNGLFRDVLFNRILQDPFDLLQPRDLFDRLRDLDRRTCELGISHALHSWSGALTANRTTSWSTGITSLVPNQGCAGTIVHIHGSGFGAIQPSDVLVMFPQSGGGCTAARVISWSDTEIEVEAPLTVGAGCVGFMRTNQGGANLAEAASTLAGEMVRCIGLAAFNAAGRIEAFGSRPLLSCPPCLPGGLNQFTGGLPTIDWFNVAGDTDVICYNGDALTLSWSVRNAATIEIVAVQVPGGPNANEHLSVLGPLNPMSGTYYFPIVTGTYSWDREYELRAWNSCTPLNAPVTRRIIVRMRSKPDIRVAGLEITQATQFFDASSHMLNSSAWRANNSVPLIAGKPTVVRVFLDSGQASSFDNGEVKGIRGRLHGRDAARNVLPGSPLAPLDATFMPQTNLEVTVKRRPSTVASAGGVAAERTLPPTGAFLFQLPPSWLAAGTIVVTAEAIVPAGVVERNAANNSTTQTLVFNAAGLPLRLAVVRVSYTDPTTNAVVAPPSLFQVLAETDQLQRVFPSNRSLLNIVPAPFANPWFYGGGMAGGPGCGWGFSRILSELATRAFFTFGMEDRVWLALLNSQGVDVSSVPASGCGMPMSSMGIGTIAVGSVLISLLTGPFAAAALYRLGTCALGVCAAFTDAPSAAPASGNATSVGTLAQEVGHAFGIFHINDGTAPPLWEPGWPDYELGNPIGSIGEFGLDIDDFFGLPPRLRAFIPRTFLPVFAGPPSSDFMGYAGTTNWVSPHIYERLMGGRPVVPSPPAAPAPARPLVAIAGHSHRHDETPDTNSTKPAPEVECILVRGIIQPGAAELWPAYMQKRRIRFIDESDSSESHTKHWLELQDRDGTTLVRRPVEAFDHHARSEHDDADGFLFVTVLPWNDRTSRLALRSEHRELAAVDVPSEPPSISLPAIERTSRGLRIAWEAEHDRKAELRYLIRYATNAERQWQFLAADLSEPVLEIPNDLLPGSSNAFFQIGATVAGQTSWVESNPIEIPPSSPEVTIIAPSSNSDLRFGDEVSLRGEALTLEHGQLSDENLTWRSDVDGNLGSGRHVRGALSAGTHTVALTATSPFGPSTTTTITLRVGYER